MGENALENATGLPSSQITTYSLAGNGHYVLGGMRIKMGLWNGASPWISADFYTAPTNPADNGNFPDSAVYNMPSDSYLLLLNAINFIGAQYGQETMGLPYFFNFSGMYWAAPSSHRGWGVGLPSQ